MKTDYKNTAKEARKKVLSMIHKAQTSHIGSNLSVIDIATVLYDRAGKDDVIIWSKGWAAATAYYFLSKNGYFESKKLDSFPKEPFIGLTEVSVNGVVTSGGSMGHGLPVGVGIAIGKKRSGSPGRVFVIMSDGEMDCGTTWESALLASHNKLDNLTVIIDYNKWQAMGRTNEVLNIEPLGGKWRAFGFWVAEFDGHNYEQLELAIDTKLDKPTILVAHTVKGKGVSFMEDALLFHYKYVSDEEYKKAMDELNA
jgi:transketolase